MIFTAQDVQNFNEQKFAYLLVEENDHVLTITLNRPDKKNAMNPVLMYELAYALAYARYENNVWVVVLAAKGDTFCAGADLKAFAGAAQEETVSTIPQPKVEVLVGEIFAQLHKPCIARVHGGVLAGGFLLICGCTHVVASDNATFSLPEAKRGLWPMQVMASLAPILPARKVLDLCMRCQTLSAKEAYEIGLITDVTTYENLDADIAKIVGEIKEQSPTAIRMGLEAFDEMRKISAAESHAYLKSMLGKLIQSQDAQEGLAAFMQKRKPNWTGK